MDLGLRGRVALVTAGSRGLGRATAVALAGEGVKVMLSARHAASLDEARSSIAANGAEVEARVADLSDPEAPAALVAATVEAFGRIDIVIANNGGPPAARALDLDDEALRDALNANLLSAVRLTREALPFLRRGSWGRICYLTSYSVVQPVPALALSNTARVGLWAWVKTAAQDIAAEQNGITLNLICPGPHATDRMKELGGSGVMGDPADFGSVATFLCSEQAKFINGAALVVDGGSTLAL